MAPEIDEGTDVDYRIDGDGMNGARTLASKVSSTVKSAGTGGQEQEKSCVRPAAVDNWQGMARRASLNPVVDARELAAELAAESQDVCLPSHSPLMSSSWQPVFCMVVVPVGCYNREFHFEGNTSQARGYLSYALRTGTHMLAPIWASYTALLPCYVI